MVAGLHRVRCRAVARLHTGGGCRRAAHSGEVKGVAGLRMGEVKSIRLWQRYT